MSAPQAATAGRALRFRLAAGGVLLYAAVDVTWLQKGFGGAATTKRFSDLSACATITIAVAACAYAWRRSEGRSRKAWRLLCASTIFFAFGEYVWTTYELALGRDVPFPSMADIGFLGAIPLAAWAVISFPTAPSGVTSRVRTVLDALIIGASILFIGWATVLAPLYRAGEGTALEQAIGLAYPIGDIVIAAIVLFVIARAGSGGRATLTLLAGGLGALAFSDSAFALLTLHDAYTTGKAIDAGWDIAYLLIALAALRPTRPRLRTTARQHDAAAMVIPYVAVSLALIVTAVQKARGEIEVVLYWAMLTIVVLVIVRQILTLVENARLTQSLERQVAEREELIKRAFHDPLTELANRALFRDRLQHAMERASRNRRAVAVLFCDFDNFKTVNDRHGHAIGDRVLAQCAERFVNSVRRSDTVARLGGDEFGVLIEDGAPDRVAARLLEELEVPFDVGGEWITLSASIGIATMEMTEDPDVLMHLADIAMYAAKSRGKGRYEAYEETMLEFGEPPERGRAG